MLDVETFLKTHTLREKMKSYTNICNWTYFLLLRRISEILYRPPLPNHPERVTIIISESFRAEESGYTAGGDYFQLVIHRGQEYINREFKILYSTTFHLHIEIYDVL